MRRQLAAWLLVPHATSVVAFLAAMGWMELHGSNRTMPDLYLGIAGFAAGALALVASLAALVLHPWRRAGRAQLLALLGHLPMLGAVLGLAFVWLALHIA